MAQTVEFADTLGKHTQFASGSTRVERIITDIPSFPGRFSGSGNSGGVIDCVNSVIHLIKNSLTEDGTATIGCTGIALDKFNSWLDGQSEYEVVPGSEFTTYKPLFRNTISNKHLWTRTSEWTYVRTIRKVGSSFTVSWSDYETAERVAMGGMSFPMPATRDDYETSAFRSGVHQGLLESGEYQKWLIKNQINYTERTVGSNSEIASVVEPGQVFQPGTIVAPTSFNLFLHVPKRLYPNNLLSSENIAHFQRAQVLLDVINEKFDFNQIMLQQQIYTTHSNIDDTILDPFAGAGSGVIAAWSTGRNYIGWESVKDRARTCQLVAQHLNDGPALGS